MCLVFPYKTSALVKFGDSQTFEEEGYRGLKPPTEQELHKMTTWQMKRQGVITALSDCGLILMLYYSLDRDEIFVKVLHDCNYSGNRLTYDLFCKALCLVGLEIFPEFSMIDALHEVLARVIAVAAPVQKADEAFDAMFDAQVVSVMQTSATHATTTTITTSDTSSSPQQS